jgi:streptogramin lyase
MLSRALKCAAAVLLTTGAAFASPVLAAAITPTITEFSEGLQSPGPWAIAPGPEGNLWFVQYQTPGRIGKITPSGAITEVANGGEGGLMFNGRLTGIVTGPEGNLWFSEQNNPGKIGKVNPVTGAVNEVATGGVTPGFRENEAPEGITAGPDGNLWFTELNKMGSVARITPLGEVSEFFTGLSPEAEPGAITVGADGNLWFADLQKSSMIGRLAPGTGLITEFSEGLSSNPNIAGLAAGPDGNVWFTEYNPPGRIGKITPSGAITEVATGGLTPGFSFHSNPHGIVAGPDGHLWFAEGDEGSGPGRIGRIDPTTGAVEEFPTPTEISAPVGIALGPEGNVWFAETGADKIGKITTPPTASTTGAATTGPISATISGLANGHAQPTAVHVEYGPIGGALSESPEQALGSPATATAVSLGLTGLAPTTKYQARVVATNPTGSIAGTFVTFTTGSLPSPAPGIPVVTAVHQLVSKWREGVKTPQASVRHHLRHRLPVGTTFSFSLNELAAVKFEFTRLDAGRRVGHRCVAKARTSSRHKICRRPVSAGTLSLGGHSGFNKVLFQGRISRSRSLEPGRYTLVITATNSAGQTSAPRHLGFTIVR